MEATPNTEDLLRQIKELSIEVSDRDDEIWRLTCNNDELSEAIELNIAKIASLWEKNKRLASIVASSRHEHATSSGMHVALLDRMKMLQEEIRKKGIDNVNMEHLEAGTGLSDGSQVLFAAFDKAYLDFVRSAYV